MHRKPTWTIFKAISSQAIMAKLLKMAKITQNSHSGLVWNGHKIWSMWVFYASSRINVHHQWKRNWKICIGSNVMAKTKSGVEFWPFPLYFWLFWGQNGHSSGNSSRPPRELKFFLVSHMTYSNGKMLWANSNSKILFFWTPLARHSVLIEPQVWWKLISW